MPALRTNCVSQRTGTRCLSSVFCRHFRTARLDRKRGQPVNAILLSGTVDSTPRLRNGKSCNLLAFDLRHEVRCDGHCSETLTEIRVYGGRAVDFAKLKHGDR